MESTDAYLVATVNTELAQILLQPCSCGASERDDENALRFLPLFEQSRHTTFQGEGLARTRPRHDTKRTVICRGNFEGCSLQVFVPTHNDSSFIFGQSLDTGLPNPSHAGPISLAWYRSWSAQQFPTSSRPKEVWATACRAEW